jgi:hypothetical protein
LYAQKVLLFAPKTKTPLAIFKAYIHKAFDTVNWNFLLKVMQHLGFTETWLDWISRLVLQGHSQILIKWGAWKENCCREGGLSG